MFTPDSVVSLMLDAADYKTNLYGKSLLECSCGNGNILVRAVGRYIEDALNSSVPIVDIRRGLHDDFTGIDIDESCCSQCVIRLNEIACSYGINNVDWDIRTEDYLYSPIDRVYDYVIGNPPYVCYRDLDADTRTALRGRFVSCAKGPFDYYYAFIEHSIGRLSNNGKMCFVVPNNIWKNVFASALRTMMLPILTSVYDYGAKKVFDVLTSSTVFVLEKDANSESISFHGIETGTNARVRKSNLRSSEKWVFPASGEEKKPKNAHVRFGDYFQASSPVATLLNRAFLLESTAESERGDSEDDSAQELISSDIVLDATSPRYRGRLVTAKIICPYTLEDGVNPISEDVLRKDYRVCYEHLLRFKDDLLARDADENAQWYEYGRRQGLNTIQIEKLMLSTVITGKVNVYPVAANTVVFAGVVIVPLAEESLESAARILGSPRFFEYVKRIGTNVSGSSLRITARDINEYRFPEGDLIG